MRYIWFHVRNYSMVVYVLSLDEFVNYKVTRTLPSTRLPSSILGHFAYSCTSRSGRLVKFHQISVCQCSGIFVIAFDVDVACPYKDRF